MNFYRVFRSVKIKGIELAEWSSVKMKYNDRNRIYQYSVLYADEIESEVIFLVIARQTPKLDIH